MRFQLGEALIRVKELTTKQLDNCYSCDHFRCHLFAYECIIFDMHAYCIDYGATMLCSIVEIELNWVAFELNPKKWHILWHIYSALHCYGFVVRFISRSEWNYAKNSDARMIRGIGMSSTMTTTTSQTAIDRKFDRAHRMTTVDDILWTLSHRNIEISTYRMIHATRYDLIAR